MTIYKVIPISQLALAYESGFIPDQPADIQSRIFIHLCDDDSVVKTCDKFFPNKSMILLALKDDFYLSQPDFAFIYETNHEGGNFYPHLYRSPNTLIPITAISHVQTYE